MIAIVLLVGLVAVATATDLARHKIYNWTTYPGILAALGLNAVGACLGEPVSPSGGWPGGTLGWIGLGEARAGFWCAGWSCSSASSSSASAAETSS